ncbi:MAG: Asp23/Gls24 family envelope stress response protein, partial [Clostridia bacterium]|nr:Asp23/Gls24 family envelope stress response protein [Clostridia bacterium]
VIAGLAATEVEGVAGMSGGIAGGIAEMLGRKNLAKGVKVEVGEKETAIDLHTIVHYGVRIPDVALQIQQRVKDAVERMTGLRVVEVNVHVQGVAFAGEEDETPRVR